MSVRSSSVAPSPRRHSRTSRPFPTEASRHGIAATTSADTGLAVLLGPVTGRRHGRRVHRLQVLRVPDDDRRDLGPARRHPAPAGRGGRGAMAADPGRGHPTGEVDGSHPARARRRGWRRLPRHDPGHLGRRPQPRRRLRCRLHSVVRAQHHHRAGRVRCRGCLRFTACPDASPGHRPRTCGRSASPSHSECSPIPVPARTGCFGRHLSAGPS